MAMFSNGMKLGGSIAIGAGVVLLAPVVVPVIAGALRPVAKAAIKGGILAYAKLRESTAETVESIEDLAAEAKAEMTESTKSQKSTKSTTKKASASASSK